MRPPRTALLFPLVLVLPLLVQPSSALSAKDRKPVRLQSVITAPRHGTTQTPTNRPEITISGRAASSRRITQVRVYVRSTRGTWVRPAKPRGRTWHRAHGKRRWSLSLVLPPGTYVVTARAQYQRKVERTPSRVRFTVRGRDPLRWPYPSSSYWNQPRGRNALLVPFAMDPPEKTLRAEEELLFMAPDLPRDRWTRLAPHTAGWKGDRCTADWYSSVELGDDTAFPMPPLVPGEQSGSFPNHATAIVMPDYTLRETQPVALCEDGMTSQYASQKWQGDSLLHGGRGPSSGPVKGGGSHGGSFMTAYGGTIRLGEWVRGGTIPHATKIDVYSQMWLTQARSRFAGYRWPALAADSGWDGSGGYGSRAPRQRPADAVMGALLTLPNGFRIDRLRTEPARILARSIRDYGTYVVDGTGRDTVTFATEWSSRGRVLDEFQREFGFDPLGDWQPGVHSPKNAFLEDLRLVYRHLQIIADNGPSRVGGSGPRMTFRAPPLQMPR